MMRKSEYKSSHCSDDPNNGQLLRDIEEISKALYLHRAPSKNSRSKSAGRVLLSESKSKSSLNPRSSRQVSLHKDSKSSSLWNWKKPLKALTHIGTKRFQCCFYLHVHSIENLPSSFDNLNLSVHWKRKEKEFQTWPSKVSLGTAEFEETLMNRCSVYGSIGGPDDPVKYESKLFLLSTSVIEAPGLDIGKQWVDFTNFLPRTLAELEGDKIQGRWSTSFALLGKAKCASLNVSIGFWVIPEKLANSIGSSNFPELLSMMQNSSAVNNGSLSRSLDVKVCREVLLRTGLELSNSLSSLYQKFDYGNLCISEEPVPEEPDKQKAKLDLDFDSIEEIEGHDWDIAEFNVTVVGMEISENQHLDLDHGTDDSIDGLQMEIINFSEMIKDYETEIDEVNGDSTNFIDDGVDIRASYKANRSVLRSLSLDNVAESVATDFLNMLEMNYDPPESPRELLLRQFEEDALASGNFLFDFDTKHEESEIGCGDDPGFSFRDYSKESNLDESKSVSELLKRRKAESLEELHTEALIRQWGLNEKDSQNIPRTCSDGFGSPIELYSSHPLEEGFVPYVQMKKEGFLGYMNPARFKNTENGVNFIIHASKPVIIPAEMGSDVMVILQNMALIGAEKLYEQINKFSPLEDITEKTMKQVALDSDQTRILLEFESLEDQSPFVVDKVEALLLEGLKIQSQMSDEDPPSRLYPQSSYTSDLLNLSITLDEWLSHDYGNDLTIVQLAQLRDPHGNYSPVGVPVLLLMEIRRRISGFQISGVHLAGVNTLPHDKQLWGATADRESGIRWLLASGYGSKSKSKSKSKVQSENILWSVSSNIDELVIPGEAISHTRNPDIIF